MNKFALIAAVLFSVLGFSMSASATEAAAGVNCCVADKCEMVESAEACTAKGGEVKTEEHAH